MKPTYNLDKIKFATDKPTFERAIGLYEKGKVTQFKEEIGACSAVVLGAQPYRVSIEARRFGLASCECYLGQVVLMLQEYAKLDPKCIKAFKKLCHTETCFDWEDPLVKIFDEQNINKK